MIRELLVFGRRTEGERGGTFVGFHSGGKTQSQRIWTLYGALFVVPLTLLFDSPARAQRLCGHLRNSTGQDFGWINSFKPPAKGAQEDVEDLKAVVDRVRTVTREDCREANTQKVPDLRHVFDKGLRNLDGLLRPNDLVALEDFFSANLWSEVECVVHELKERFDRPRPFRRDASVENHQVRCMPPHRSASYPSGHAALARIGALLLVHLFPQQEKLWMSLGNRGGELRMLAGLHHPSDIRDGQEIADRVFKILLETPSFQVALNGLKEKLARP